MNKRGLSQVVTMVIIILVVIAAIVLIWSAVRPTIQNAGDQITADCFTIDLEPVSCMPGQTAGQYDVRVKRNAGGGILTGLKLIFMATNGDESVVDWPNTDFPEQLETGTATLTGNYVGNQFRVAGVVGQGNICPESSISVTCS